VKRNIIIKLFYNTRIYIDFNKSKDYLIKIKEFKNKLIIFKDPINNIIKEVI
jgi:hypothetical protein